MYPVRPEPEYGARAEVREICSRHERPAQWRGGTRDAVCVRSTLHVRAKYVRSLPARAEQLCRSSFLRTVRADDGCVSNAYRESIPPPARGRLRWMASSGDG